MATGALMGLRLTGRWRVLPAAGAFLLVPVVATPLVLVAPDLRVDATTASPADAPAVPGSVSTVAWTFQVDGQVQDAVAAGTGVVLLLDDGVVALDGRTGDVRWSRARHGASPDGVTVMVQWTTSFTVPNGWLLPLVCPTKKVNFQYLMVDGTTGKVPWSYEMPFSGGGDVSIDAVFSPDREVLAVRASA